jgi:hypothetical protein
LEWIEIVNQSNATASTESNGRPLAKLSARLDEAEDYLDDVEGRLGDIEGSNVEAPLDEIERRLDVALSLRLDWLERDVRALTAGMEGHLSDHYGPPRPVGQ